MILYIDCLHITFLSRKPAYSFPPDIQFLITLSEFFLNGCYLSVSNKRQVFMPNCLSGLRTWPFLKNLKLIQVHWWYFHAIVTFLDVDIILNLGHFYEHKQKSRALLNKSHQRHNFLGLQNLQSNFEIQKSTPSAFLRVIFWSPLSPHTKTGRPSRYASIISPKKSQNRGKRHLPFCPRCVPNAIEPPTVIAQTENFDPWPSFSLGITVKSHCCSCSYA